METMPKYSGHINQMHMFPPQWSTAERDQWKAFHQSSNPLSWIQQKLGKRLRSILPSIPELVYKPLPSANSFRVLEIYPDEVDTMIQCRLRPAEVGDGTHYCALSYTWGDQQPSEPILCDGQFAYVTPMLREALRRFRLAGEGVGNLATVWADAICISQSDKDEKSAQVLLMKHIFRDAAQVCAFLGDADFKYPEFAALYDKCLALSQEVPPATLEQLKPETTLWRTFGLPGRFDPVWQDLIRFITHPWFKRVWIVQEYCLSQDAMISYGPFSAPADNVISVLQLLFANGMVYVLARTAQDLATKELLASMGPYFRFLDGLRKRVRDGHNPRLDELLIKQPAHGATDPRDQIYGLLGLSSDSDAVAIKPDYRLDIGSVYINVCHHALQAHGSLHFLYDCSMQQSLSLPSWVPDWSVAKATNSLTREMNLPNGLVPYVYKAAADTTPSFQLLPAGALSLKGVFVDEISEVAADHWSTMKSNPDVVVLVPGEMELGRTYHIPSDDGFFLDPLGDSAWFRDSRKLAEKASASLAADRADQAAESPTGDADSVRHTHLATLTAHNPSRRRGVGCDASLWAQYTAFKRATENGSSPDPGEVSDFLGAAMPVCGGRRVCLTSRGYLAHVPAEAVVGDKVAVFLGAIVPFVLRKSPDVEVHHIVIGECYVHGLMSGQGLSLPGVKIEDIKLT